MFPGPPIRVIEDTGGGAVSSVDYLQVGHDHILVWNRLEPLERAHRGTLGAVVIAYSVATDTTPWSKPYLLLAPPDGLCGLITPAIARDPIGRITLFAGAIAPGRPSGCPLTNWSKRIVRFNFVLVDG